MVRPLLFAALLLMPCAAFAQENPAGSSNQTSPPVSGDTVQAPPSSSGTTLTLNDLAWTNGSVFTQDSSGVTLTPQVFGGTVALDMPDRRVTLDLDNASLRDALKSVFDQAKEKYDHPACQEHSFRHCVGRRYSGGRRRMEPRIGLEERRKEPLYNATVLVPNHKGAVGQPLLLCGPQSLQERLQSQRFT